MTGSEETFRRGLEDFRSGRFFEAHEEWESLWMEAAGDERRFLQALIQLAAACVHLSRGRAAPGLRLLGLSREKLGALPDVYGGLEVASLAACIRSAESRLTGGEPLSPEDLFPLVEP